MSKFLDGPANGVVLQLRRAPLYLRVVWDAAGKVDALGRRVGELVEGETITAYRRVDKAGVVHVDYTEKGRRRSVWFALADYRVVEPQPDPETMRDTALWRAWCTEQMAMLKAEESMREQE